MTRADNLDFFIKLRSWLFRLHSDEEKKIQPTNLRRKFIFVYILLSQRMDIPNEVIPQMLKHKL